MVITHIPCALGAQNLRTVTEEGVSVGVRVDVTPFRKVSYFVRGKPCSPLGKKSPTAKYIPYFREMLKEVTI